MDLNVKCWLASIVRCLSSIYNRKFRVYNTIHSTNVIAARQLSIHSKEFTHTQKYDLWLPASVVMEIKAGSFRREIRAKTLLPIFLIRTSRAPTAVEKIFEFLDARLDVKALTNGGTRAPDWLARQGRILGRHCRACRFTWEEKNSNLNFNELRRHAICYFLKSLIVSSH